MAVVAHLFWVVFKVYTLIVVDESVHIPGTNLLTGEYRPIINLF